MPKFDSIDHLNFEAVAALIDDELTPTALHRAQNHLNQCPECRQEVAQQRAAAEAVREHNTEGCLRAPRSLVERLAHLGDGDGAFGAAAGSSAAGSAETRTSGSPENPADGRPGGPAHNPSRKWPVSWDRLRNGLR